MPDAGSDAKPAVSEPAVADSQPNGSVTNGDTPATSDTNTTQEKHVYYKSDRSGSNGSRQKRKSFGGYGNNNYNDNKSRQGGNRYINSSSGAGGNYYNSNTARYNAGSGFNRSMAGYDPQQGMGVGMGWQGYYPNPMYYMPQQMAMMNGGMYLDPAQYAGRAANGSADAGEDGSETAGERHRSPVVPEIHHTKIEITTKAGERLNLNAIHDHNTHKDGVDGTAKTSADAATGGDSAAVAATATVDEEQEKKNQLQAQKEAEREKNKKAFLEQVRLRKLALDAKNKKEPEESKGVEKKPEEVETKEKTAEDADTTQPELAETVAAKDSIVSEEPAVDTDSPHKATPDTEAPTPTHIDVEPPVVDRHVQIKTPEPFRREVPNDTENSTQADNDNEKTESNNDNADNEENTPIEHNDINDEKDANDAEDANNNIATDNKANEQELPDGNNTNSLQEDSDALTMSGLLEKLNTVNPIDDIYAFDYPSPFTPPEEHYRKEHIKYTYGPLFLLQFQDKMKVKADDAWITNIRSKIVIPPGSTNRFKGRSNSRRESSNRNMDNHMGGSRMSSKRQSRKFEERRSGRTSYTSRRDRERAGTNHSMGAFERPVEKPQEPVAPLVPTANRWVPKSRQKKTEKKFAPDGVTELLTPDEVESKMKSLLNKLTLEKFDSISTEILDIANISKWETDGATLQNVIQQIFNKATDEPHWSSMYAQLCGKLVKDVEPEIGDEGQDGKSGPKLVLHYLVDICHTDFEKGWVDKLPTNEDGSPLEPEMMSEEYYQAAAAKRRGLGLVRLIGFLYRLNLLSGKMMFECFRRLMKDLTDSPSEEVIESVIELLTTVGEKFETDSFKAGKGTLEGSVLLDSLFGILDAIVKEDKISNRIKFKLMDIKELREKKHWNSDKKNAGPKTIQQIHQEEEQARHLKNSRAPSHRRGNNGDRSRQSNWGGSSNSRRDVRRDSFTSTRTGSSRYSQRGTPQKEEKPKRPTNTNRFSALMHDSGDF
ncbi:translation initiation factor eIF4G [Maudiozyma humilis]|uniref:Translation initiation factor eIF4G n=1 Tax=Maudiozyma humilis TaxID=51915 RepID=A0AAV5S3D3_MAUHU|nr:translation initiation factor eIF4G [Kazachstania humilis]